MDTDSAADQCTAASLGHGCILTTTEVGNGIRMRSDTMPKLVLGAIIFFGLLNSLPLEAQGNVSLNVCNAGKVDVDVFLSQNGKVSDSHVRPADCASLA